MFLGCCDIVSCVVITVPGCLACGLVETWFYLILKLSLLRVGSRIGWLCVGILCTLSSGWCGGLHLVCCVFAGWFVGFIWISEWGGLRVWCGWGLFIVAAG